eukprot:COSAG01_NODE_1717_length_9398_cov_83.738574_4_plen_516_part_00
MGPTSIVPGTQFLGIDREGFPHSEERIDRRMAPPKSVRGWQDALLDWNGHALSVFGLLGVDPASGDLPLAERESRIADFAALFGDPTLIERKLTVPAGSLVIKHQDIVHRRCRSGTDGVSDEGVTWRPMFGLSFNRVAEPSHGSLLLAANDAATDIDDFSLTQSDDFSPTSLTSLTSLTGEEAWSDSAAKVSIWQSVLSWMQGRGPGVVPVGLAHSDTSTVAHLTRALVASDTELQRVGSAYSLGHIAAAGNAHHNQDIADAAVRVLEGAMRHSLERVRRAATWAIGVAGARAAGPLQGLLSTTGLPNAQATKTNAAWAIGTAASAADCSVGVMSAVVDSLAGTVQECELALQSKVDALASADRNELEALFNNKVSRGWGGRVYSCTIEITHDVHELRKTMAAAAQSLGLVGRRVVALDEGQLALKIVRMLKALRGYSDPAKIFPTHLSAGIIQAHAERGLCAMLAPPASPATNEPQDSKRSRQPHGLVEIAVARLADLSSPNKTQTTIHAEMVQ